MDIDREPKEKDLQELKHGSDFKYSTRSLFSPCRGYLTSKKMRGVSVPDYCWKVVQGLNQKKFFIAVGLRTAQKQQLKKLPLRNWKRN